MKQNRERKMYSKQTTGKLWAVQKTGQNWQRLQGTVSYIDTWHDIYISYWTCQRGFILLVNSTNMEPQAK